MAEETTWLETLPEDIRQNPSLTKFKTPVELAKSYIEAQGLLGSSVRAPGPEATPEARAEFRKKMQEKVPELIYAPEGDEATEAAFWKRLGKPEKLEEYEVPPDAAELGLNADELRAAAAEIGLTKAQFKKMVKGMVEPTVAKQNAIKEATAALKAEWGAAFEEKVTDAKAAALKMGVPEADLGKLSPAQLKVFANVAKAVGGGAPFAGQKGEMVQPGIPTPTEAAAQIAEIQQREEYFRPKPFQRATHEALKAKVAKLMEYV